MSSKKNRMPSAERVYSTLWPHERAAIIERYNNREPMTSIARNMGFSLNIVRTFIKLEISAKRIKEQIDLRRLEREITKAKEHEDILLERRLGNVDDNTAPRASDQYLHDKRAAKAGSRKLLEALHAYFERREAAQKEADSGNV